MCSPDGLSSAVAEATSCGHEQVQELPPLHGRRKWANTETNSMQEAAKGIQPGTCWIFLPFEMFLSALISSKNLPWVERACAWHWHYLAGSSAAHEFINSAILLVQNVRTHNLWEPEKYASDISATSSVQILQQNSFWSSGASLAHANSLWDQASHLYGFCPCTSHHQTKRWTGAQNHLILCKSPPLCKI